ncbi:MAG: hypothetical protein MUE44_17645 [Oscillatoriaceae cyanobacterium Prado104]|nr:hypothetical protein [Oscillatoriaceae cyanobacterium Prado104]
MVVVKRKKEAGRRKNKVVIFRPWQEVLYLFLAPTNDIATVGFFMF